MSKEKLLLSFGAMAPSLDRQLESVGLDCDFKRLAHYQADADAITRLAIRGLLPDSAVKTARKRLVRALGQEVTRSK